MKEGVSIEMYKSLAKKAERKGAMRELDPDTHCLVLVWGTCNVYSTWKFI